MEQSDYTETFASYILECKRSYETVCETIDNGDIPAGKGVTITIEIAPKGIDAIRFDRLALIAETD